MSKFSETVILLEVGYTYDDEGVSHEEVQETEVFFNPYRVGFSQQLEAKTEGLGRIVRGEVRSVEYSGQSQAKYKGKEYDIIGSSDTGELTTLSMAEHLRNV